MLAKNSQRRKFTPHPRTPSKPSKPEEDEATPIDWFGMTRVELSITVSKYSWPEEGRKGFSRDGLS
jgi:hypothetical protein